MSDTTFPREARLLCADDFARVRKEGRRARSGPLLVSCVAGRTRRLGVICTRKTGNAVTRNRIRRVIREFFRVQRTRFPAGDCVVIPQTGAASLTNDEIRELLDKALTRLGAKDGQQ